MNIGMLWFDDNPKLGITYKIKQASTYYQDKYGKYPNLCLIHPTMISEKSIHSVGKDDVSLEIHTAPFVQPNHFWIGIKTE